MARSRCLRGRNRGLSLAVGNIDLKPNEVTIMRHEDIQRKGAPHWKVHPGEILREEFLKPLGISAYELAKRLHVPAPRVNDIVLERRGISADTALRLSRFFGTRTVLAEPAGCLRSEPRTG